uniref:universal stress protein n=1 Tax=uncultured Draconibacterium sp. TaxID=1573823 RepID=UPI00321633FB
MKQQKKKSHSILAFVPPNNEGKLVLKEAMFFQKKLGMHLYIINVVEAPSFYARKFLAEKVFDTRMQALQELNSFIKTALGSEIPENISVDIAEGDIASTLIRESKQGGHQFILIDKSKNQYPGSLNKTQIDELVSKSKCPVLTVDKDSGISNIHNIIIPIDISQSTKKRLLWAAMFAQKFGAKITVLSALNANITKQKSLAYENAKRIRHLLWSYNIDCEIKVLKVHQQDKHRVILDYIKEHDSGLVIIRTHQDLLFANTKIGEFVSEIVHGCKQPVFSVNYTPNPLQSLVP